MFFHHILFRFDSTKSFITSEQSTIIDNHIQKNGPKLTYKFWTLEKAKEFLSENYKEFAKLFEKASSEVRPIVLCDFFRYVLMYHFGGIYTDLDFLMIRPVDDFLNMLKEDKLMFFPKHVRNPTILLSEEWLNSTEMSKTLHNGILISLVEKHPFWLKLLYEIYDDIICKGVGVKSENEVYVTSGPQKLLKYYQENKDFFKDVCILPHYYFCPFISEEYDATTNKTKITLYNNMHIDESNSTSRNWSFFNINDYHKLVEYCPNSFFVNVYLNMGSMWK